MIAYTLVRYPEADAYGGIMPLGMYLTYCVLYLVGGFAAGAVAGQIRTHVAAALGEAKARRKAEQFEADDIPFGISSGIDYGPANDMQLAPGDILVLVTDGFFKWCNTAGTPQPDDLTAVVVKRVG
ncbi:MAG: SpoIIE family protein phosphatase [Planctomycetes bacterium]|nr:SpoIIE family protein phosphatase [Planctomycetota bacterium]